MREKLSDNEMIGLVSIKLVDVNDIKEFVQIANTIPTNVTLTSNNSYNNYVIDGKSIFGVLSLNWDKSVILETNEKYIEKFRKWIL